MQSTIYLLNDSAIVPPLQNVTVQYLSIAEAVVALGSQPSNVSHGGAPGARGMGAT
jgi:hypothetical protein